MRLRSLLSPVWFVAAVLAVGGCSSSGEKKQTEKEKADERWRAARAAVMVNLANNQYRNGQFEQARKSTDEGLEQSFNSLDAQREACTAYIQSQAHEGWELYPELYDDGGYSGGSM